MADTFRASEGQHLSALSSTVSQSTAMHCGRLDHLSQSISKHVHEHRETADPGQRMFI